MSQRSWLELKIPPPVVALLLAGVAWLIAWAVPVFALDLPGVLRKGLAATLVLAGLSFDVLALLRFRSARTTINPLDPSRSSALVERGVYRITRNPMYLGLLLVLAGWTVWLDHALTFVVLPLFVAYITRFQIVPEERILADRFGEPYAGYRTRVHRWL